MKASVSLLVFLTFALRAAAQEGAPPQRIDASPERLRQFVASIPEPPPKPPRKVIFRFGQIEFRALGMRWRIGYLPIETPLPGTRFGIPHERMARCVRVDRHPDRHHAALLVHAASGQRGDSAHRENGAGEGDHPAKTTLGFTSTGPPSRSTFTTSAIATS